MELKVSSRSQAGHTVVGVSGEIDLYTAPRLTAELNSVLAKTDAGRIVVDMSGVEFCDSTGMNVLLSALKRAREQGGRLELAGPRPAVRKILQVTGLDTVFTVLDDIHRPSRETGDVQAQERSSNDAPPASPSRYPDQPGDDHAGDS